MTTRSSGFTLIELLVVVAIIGILSAVGVVSYSGYVSATKKKAAENTLYQLALAQTEFFTDNRIYKVDANSNCPASAATTKEIATALLGGTGIIPENFNFCADTVDELRADGSTRTIFQITATSTPASGLGCVIVINENNMLDNEGCP